MPFDDNVPTPGLDEFLAAFNRDDNEWWRLSPGHQLNLFEEAVDRLAKLNDERLELVGNFQAANEHVTQLVGEKQRLLQRIADLEKAQEWLAQRDAGVAAKALEDVAGTFTRPIAKLLYQRAREIRREVGGE